MVEAPTLCRMSRRIKHGRGFTYLSLIIVVAIIALVAASALKLGSVLQRSRAEQELLTIGAAFSDALKSYADATPQGQATQPPSLKELLKDPRFPGTRRHLRKIFVDPMTGNAEWGITYLGNKTGVLAVYSLSAAKPVKIGNFPARFGGFEDRHKISDWKFTMAAEQSAARSAEEKPTPTTIDVSVPPQNSPGQQQISPIAPAAPVIDVPIPDTTAPAPEEESVSPLAPPIVEPPEPLEQGAKL
ncbi:type II secretion system protein [Duganella sp. BuS-21]|uniref:type II secretion system protein n=1 Tax=Duganella sp. BuS-21 TaxID=2943848 RepID=UPI0035A705A9